jgi:polyhydroxyalkanoate synthesis repressor PhaR
MRIIKRYANRKLYDTEAHRYVTLQDLAELVRKDETIKVQDHATGEDYTTVTLALIISEEEKRGPKVAVSVLEKVIREGIPATAGAEQAA